MKYALIILIAFTLTARTGLPDGIEPVEGFDVDLYLGKWYEIARLDHSFERGLSNVSATYTLRNDGGIEVINRGFSTQDNVWEEAKGKAYFTGDQSIGHLKCMSPHPGELMLLNNI